MKLQKILNKVKKVIQISYPDYDIVIKRLHLYYDMRLVTFLLCSVIDNDIISNDTM